MTTAGGYALLLSSLMLTVSSACAAAPDEDTSGERRVAPAPETEATADPGVPAAPDAGAPDATPPIVDGPPVLGAPADGETVHTRRPALRWSGRPADSTATLQICRDTTCALADVTVAALAGQGPPPSDLEPGTYHWRVAWVDASDPTNAWSELRSFVVAEDAPATVADPDLLSVWAVAPGEAFAAGADGTILHRAAGAWVPEASGTTVTLHGVWASADGAAWAVGDGGTILRRDPAGTWAAVPSPASEDLRGVWAAGPDAAWAVGLAGTLLRWDGAAWSRVNVATGGELTALNAVWGRSADDVWAVGGGREADRDYAAIVLHWDGATWSTSYVCNPEGTRYASGGWVASLADVWGVADGALWTAGGCGPGAAQMSIGFIADDKAGTWAETAAAHDFFEDRALDAVWASAPDDVWVAAGNSWTPRIVPTLLHFDGSAWRASSDPELVGIRDLGGTGPKDVWAVGAGGKRLHYDGSGWSESF